MTSKHALVARWATPAGQGRAEAIMDGLESRMSTPALKRIVAGIEYADDVAPALDLRGLQFKDSLWLKGLDLSGARLDYAVLDGGIADCLMVGAVLDGFRSENAYMGKDFRGATFVKADLKGCRFYADLTGANFFGANLRSARFEHGAKCVKTSFERARMVFAELPAANLRGANLTGADLRGAVLGGVRFNDETRVQGANLTDASMDDDFINFATQHGAVLGPPSGTFELAQFVATLEELERTNEDHQWDGVLPEMFRLRDIMTRNPLYDWSEDLARVLSPALMEDVVEAFREATSNM